MNFYKKKIFYIFLPIFCFLVGTFFFLFQRNWLIIQWVFSSKEEIVSGQKQEIILRKKINLYYYKDDKFVFEPVTFIWLKSKAENLKHLINNWLSFLHEERIVNKKFCIETIALTESGQQAYFSFDQSPLDREWSTYKKWNFIESMFKTIRQANLDIKTIYFLVGNQPMEDDHLDFSQGWPVDGFL